MRTDKSYMIVISHFKLYPALFPLKWLICIPNISAVRGNVVFETLHDFYRTAIDYYIYNRHALILPQKRKNAKMQKSLQRQGAPATASV